MSLKNSDETLQIREIAKKSIKRKRDAWQFLIVYVLVNTGLVILWSISGGGYFWPGWVLFGMGIGLVLTFIDAYAKSFRSKISESEIDAEIEKLKKAKRI
jgi:hypothetical protein